jgi:hypothetical protein
MSRYYLRSVGIRDNVLVTLYYGPFLTKAGAEQVRKQAQYPEEFEIFLSLYSTTDDLVAPVNKTPAYYAQKVGAEPFYEAVSMRSVQDVRDKPRFL